MKASEQIRISVVIPTFQRGQIVVETAQRLMALKARPDELLIVDQTQDHSSSVLAELAKLAREQGVRVIKLKEPSIPAAMNVGLREASGEVVLFLDDDIIPDDHLVQTHLDAQASGESCLVAGMVLQPGERAESLSPVAPFRFNSDAPARITEFMGGNFSVRRDAALDLGGFDENFKGAAYRFEAEFAHRYRAKHGLICFEPRAIIHHLQVGAGGTRAHGHHLRTAGPAHAVGAFYYLFRCKPQGWIWQMLWRPFRSVRTRFHMTHPWWIPLTLWGEMRGLALALRLWMRGPRLLTSVSNATIERAA